MTDIAAGDLDALGVLYTRYAADVWRAASRVSNGSPDVEDVVHKTFLALPKIAASFDASRGTCKRWLVGVAVRVTLRHTRDAGRLARILRQLVWTRRTRDDADPETQAGHREELAIFERALQQLTVKHRAVFVLVELDGLSQVEVAAALELPAATVRSRLFQARRELREKMERGGR